MSLDSAGLRLAGRQPPAPVALELGSGDLLHIERWLRVLPGKRLTGLGEYSGRPVVAKLFVAGRGAQRHWQRERVGIEQLQQAGVPTPTVLAADALPGDGYFLLTEYLAGASSPPGAVSPAPTCAFAALGRMHARGVIQDDAHFDNFLQLDDAVFVIDGAAVRRARSATDCLENLAVLFAQLPVELPADVADQLLAAYRQQYPISVDVAALQTRIDAVRFRRLNDYLDKSLRDCSLFKVERTRSRFVSVLREHSDTLLPLIADPDEAIARGKLLKSGGTATLALVEHAGRRLVIKRYNIKGPAHALSRCWRPSRAWHSWLAGHRLRFLGIATPRPLALIEQRAGPMRGKAWLITEECAGTTLLHRWRATMPPSVEEMAALTTLFGQLKRWRISHGDFKANNLFWTGSEIALIDLDALRQHAHSGSFARAHARDRARLLRNWPDDSALVAALSTQLQTC